MLDKKTWITTAQSYLLMSLGALLLAVNFNVFMSPHQIAPGGVTGATLIISQVTGWPESSILFGLQGLMMLIGFRYLGRFQFLARTLYVSLIYSGAVALSQPWLPSGGITDDLLLNTIYGGLAGGVGLGLIFWGSGNVAGTSVISRLIQIRTGIPISQLYIFVDGGLILLQGVAFGWDKALYGMLMLFIWGMAADYVQEGPSVVRTTFIITDRPEQVATALFDRLRVGVTAWSATGMFTQHRRDVLFCTISRSDMSTLKSIVTAVDPTAFIVVGQGHQAVGGVLRQAQKKAQPAGEVTQMDQVTSRDKKPDVTDTKHRLFEQLVVNGSGVTRLNRSQATRHELLPPPPAERGDVGKIQKVKRDRR